MSMSNFLMRNKLKIICFIQYAAGFYFAFQGAHAFDRGFLVFPAIAFLAAAVCMPFIRRTVDSKLDKPMRTGVWGLLGLLLLSGYCYIENPTSTVQATAADRQSVPAYSIVKDESLHDIKRSVDVVIEGPIYREQLVKLARRIKQSENGTYERTFIGYRLKGASASGAYWATTHYDPDLVVRIIGPKKIDSQVTTIDSKTTGLDTLGSWNVVLRRTFPARAVLHKKRGSVLLTSFFEDGTFMDEQLSVSRANGGYRLDFPRRPVEKYYIVLPNGHLQYWVVGLGLEWSVPYIGDKPRLELAFERKPEPKRIANQSHLIFEGGWHTSGGIKHQLGVLISRGRSMENLRQNDMNACAREMELNQGAYNLLGTKIIDLNREQNLEIHHSFSNLRFCIACTSDALEACSLAEADLNKGR